jgi:ParB/RepB/Spo0J family partition protein
MLINIANLSVASENPRKTKADQADHEALVASLKAHGQLVPLLVRPTPSAGSGQVGKPDHFEIIDGGRRFAAAQDAGLLELKAELYQGDGSADEIGTATNMVRASMHPLDEAAVIARRVADGETPEEVAARFGHPARWAEQRMKLDELSERVKKVFRAGQISLAAAEAFTLGSKKQQDAYLKKVQHAWQFRPDEIRRHFTNAAYSAKAALFDLAAYPKAAIVTDLFGENVWLTDRDAFERLQTAAIEAKAEEVRGEGWSEVIVVTGADYTFWQKYVKAEGKILKADRARYLAFVEYDPRDGEVKIDRGFVTRESVKPRKGVRPAEDSADAAEVKPQTCYDLSPAQQNIIAALQTEGIARAIAGGDTWLALQAILTPLLAGNDDDKSPAWAGLRPSYPNWIGANATFDQKIEQPERPRVKFPTRAAFEKMPWDEVMALIRAAALASLQLLYSPDADAAKETRTAGVDWFRYDPAFLRRYRLDALQDLARHLKINSDGLKKRELVDVILAHQGKPFLPIKWKD